MQIAIEVDSITREFGQRKVVDSLSFKVKRGDIHGFLGPNGAGKTTTMRMIAGLLPSSSGKILIHGKDISLHPMQREIGLLSENPPLYLDMRVKEYLKFVGELRGLSNDELIQRCDKVMTSLDIHSISNRFIGNLSKGYKQRVGVAQAILHNPSIVILDEPTVGLDPNAVSHMRELIFQLKKEHTVLLSSHILHEVGRICDEVTIIAAGKLLASGSIEDIANQNLGHKAIHLLIGHFEDPYLQSLKRICGNDRMRILKVGNKNKITVYSNDHKEIRPALTKATLENKVELFELYQEASDLEQIFSEMTQE